MSVGRAVALIGFLIGLVAVILQFAISVPAYMADGRSLPDALLTIFSFYTILSNIALVLVYLSDLTDVSWLAAFRSPVTRAMMVAIITLVMGFYHILLAGLWAPEGLFKLADTLLHYVAPILYIVWWLAFGRRGALKWDHVPAMLFPTLIYFVYTMGRGAVSHEYPYPVLDVGTLGFGHVLLNALAVCIGLAILCLLVVLADKLHPRKSIGTATP
jgi:hypothetical protein